MHECPFDGCDFESATKNGVVMHYLNKPTHTSLQTKAEVYGELNGNEEASDPSSQESSVPTDTPSESTQADVSGSSEPVRLELPTNDTDGTDGDVNGADDPLRCPECNGERAERVSDLTDRLRNANSKEAKRVLRDVDWSALPGDAWVCGPCWENAETPKDITVYADQA